MNLVNDTKSDLLFVGFNQDYGCFACGTNRGFIIYNCDPLKERFRREFDNGGIGIVEMLFRCNILALVGGGKNPRYPPNKVMIWDDYQNKCIAELEFRSEVKAVKLRRDRIVVVLENKVYVYNFADLQLLDQLDTLHNPRGLCALCPSSNCVLACPGTKIGQVHVELYDLKQTQSIQAHNNALSQIALNLEGTLIATSSEKGTLIRVFSTANGQQLREFRRGADRAEIYSISFNSVSTFLCVSSDKSTIHIYSLDGQATPNAAQEKVAANRQSSLAFMRDILPSYFSSEWSFAHFRVPDGRAMCAFGAEKNAVVVVSSDGSFFKYIFDPVKGGEAQQEGYAVFLKEQKD